MTKERQEEIRATLDFHDIEHTGCDITKSELLDAISERDAQLSAAHDRERVLKEKVRNIKVYVNTTRLVPDYKWLCREVSGLCEIALANEKEEKR